MQVDTVRVPLVKLLRGRLSPCTFPLNYIKITIVILCKRWETSLWVIRYGWFNYNYWAISSTILPVIVQDIYIGAWLNDLSGVVYHMLFTCTHLRSILWCIDRYWTPSSMNTDAWYIAVSLSIFSTKDDDEDGFLGISGLSSDATVCQKKLYKCIY